MKIKVDPETIRLVQAIAAGLQAVTAVLTGVDALPPVVLVVVVVVGTFLQATSAAYTQGVQTEPSHGMITEELAKSTDPAVMQGIAASAGREPWPAVEPADGGR